MLKYKSFQRIIPIRNEHIHPTKPQHEKIRVRDQVPYNMVRKSGNRMEIRRIHGKFGYGMFEHPGWLPTPEQRVYSLPLLPTTHCPSPHSLQRAGRCLNTLIQRGSDLGNKGWGVEANTGFILIFGMLASRDLGILCLPSSPNRWAQTHVGPRGKSRGVFS